MEWQGNRQALPSVNKDDSHHGSVIALIEVKAALHANTLLSIQLPKHQITCMSFHCRERGGLFLFANVSI